jgi:hypothetical protein
LRRGSCRGRGKLLRIRVQLIDWDTVDRFLVLIGFRAGVSSDIICQIDLILILQGRNIADNDLTIVSWSLHTEPSEKGKSNITLCAFAVNHKR